MAKSAATGQDVLPLPQGGGAMKAIDESFKTDLSTGSGFYQIPIKLPKGVNDLTPTLALKYSTGKGNGVFGMGWDIDLPLISRQTKNKIPSFEDEKDIFNLDGRELVPMGNDRYQPEIENEFSLIKKTAQGWEVRAKNGVLLVFGETSNERVSITENGVPKIYAWLLSKMVDPNGNIISYKYLQDGNNAYLETVTYAIYRVTFKYENRPDSYRSFRTGYEVGITLRCKSIDLDIITPAPDPVKTYRLTYQEAIFSKISLLKKVQLFGLGATNSGVDEMALPPIEFDYTDFNPLSKKLQAFTYTNTPPPSLLGNDVTLLDFQGTGLPGIISISDGSARFWPNKGNLTWGSPINLKDIPLNVDLSDDSLRFADMEGNGTADLMVGNEQSSGYFPNQPGGGWGRKINYRQSPNPPLNSGFVKMVDLDGDNRVDMLYSDGGDFYCYFNKGEEGWDSQPTVIKRKHDLQTFPDVNLGDPHIRLGDIVGDGRSHLIQIFDGRVVYWPNLGNGKWGNMRRMANSPKLPRNYNPSRLFLADIDGSGAADIVYVDFDRIFCWINQSGNSFSDPVEIKGTPPVANTAILVADMRGTGTNGILWSYEESLRNKISYRYLDLAGGKKPYLLNKIKSNTGVTTTLEYGSSVEFQKDQSDPRLTGNYFLPFPVPVIKKQVMEDPSTGVTSTSHFKYYNGHFDGKQRQFLGFAKAERLEDGDESIPANKAVSYFHNLDFHLKGLSSLAFMFAQDDGPLSSKPFKSEENQYELKTVAASPSGKEIKFVSKTSVSTKTFERSDVFSEVKKSYKYDAIGNVIEELKETGWWDNGVQQFQKLKTTTTFGQNLQKWLLSFKSRETQIDELGKILKDTRYFYDGNPFEGLANGKVEKGNISRERHLVLTNAKAQEVFGLPLPDFPGLGLIQENDATTGQAFFSDRVSQKFDASGNPVERKNALGHSTKIKFDAFNIYPVEVEVANGISFKTNYEYHYGSITSYKDQNDIDQIYKYDKAGQLVAVFRHDDPVDKPHFEFLYDNNSAIRSQTTLTRANKGDVIQHKRVEYFDGVGEKLQVRSEAEDGKIIVTGKKEYNSKGLTSKEFPTYFSNSLLYNNNDQPDETVFTQNKYDAVGRSIERIDWEGNVFKTIYNVSSRSFYDPTDLDNTAGNNNFNTPQIEWLDAEDKLVTIVEKKKNSEYITHYTYDSAGNRIKAEINGSVFLENTFDNLGQRIQSRYRDAGTFTYLYDAVTNLIQRTDGNGRKVFRKYDSLSRLTELRHGGNNGVLMESYQYDTGDPGDFNTKGQLTKVNGAFGEVKYTYSKCGCIKSKTRTIPGLAGSLTFSFEQDNLKRFTKVVYPDGFEAKITYSHGGMIDSIQGIINKVHYGATGRKTKIEYANGVVTEYEYLPGSFYLKSIKTTAPDGVTTYQDLTYGYNELGLITSITDGANVAGHIKNNEAYTYDELSQLLTASGTNASGNYQHQYQYDEIGNVTRYPEQFGTDTIEHNNNQFPFRITGVQNQPALQYQYDACGNITAMPDNVLEYDAQNRLIKLTHTNGTVIEHLYDHMGVRVSTSITKDGITESTFNFDDLYVVRGVEKIKFIFDETSQIAMIEAGGGGRVFHKNHLGSHTSESDLQTGNFISEESYFAFGKLSGVVNLKSPFHYNGKKYDNLPDLVFFGGRYYMPETGRFLTADPLFLEQQPEKFFKAPRSLQLYCYVLNNPVNIIDPKGLWFGLDDLIVAAVGFVVGAAAYLINVAISGGDFSFGEFLLAGLAGAATVWLTYSTLGLGAAIVVGLATLAKPAVTGALDKAAMGNSFGERFLGFLSFSIKFASSPITSTVGLLIGGFGTGFGLWNNVEWFKGGVIAFEYDSSSTGFSAVTLGATVNIWQGNTSSASFAHELYHSRQYTYFGDAFIPLWVIGGIYGLISSAVAGKPQWSCFASANPGTAYGNPLETTAHTVDRGGGCT